MVDFVSMFPCFRVLIILYMNPWKSQVAQATLIHVCMENILHPKKCSLPDTLHTLQCPGVSIVRACVPCLAWSALHLAWFALLAVQPFRVRWGHPGEIGPEARVGAVSPVFSDQNKKGTFFANTHPAFTKRNPPDCASLQIF